MTALTLQVVDGAHAPLGTGRRVLAGRPSIRLRWQYRDLTISGEATPLPGYGEDNLARAQRELSGVTVLQLERARERMAAFWHSTDVLSVSHLSALVDDFGSGFTSGSWESPSARFCVEMMVLEAVARSEHVPVWRLLVKEPVAHVLPTSAVVDPLAADWFSLFCSRVEQGVGTFKFKCGRDDGREIRALELAREAAPNSNLRVDANGAWSLERAIAFLGAVQRIGIQWAEDPTPLPWQWSTLRRQIPVPLALDEPLASGMSIEEARDTEASFIVLKPMALGGFAVCMNWAETARTWGREVVVSHFFDGRTALGASIQLAFAIQSTKVAPGLGCHEGLGAYPGDGSISENLVGSRLLDAMPSD